MGSDGFRRMARLTRDMLPDVWYPDDEPEVTPVCRPPRVWLVVPGGGLRGMIGGTIIAACYDALSDRTKAEAIGLPELADFTVSDVFGAGVSIGGLIMGRLSEGKMHLVTADFHSVTKRKQILHTPLDFGKGIIGDGLVSMARARRHMQRRGLGNAQRSVPCWVGVIDAAGRHDRGLGSRVMLPVDDRVTRQVAEDRWMCSGSQSPGMEIITCDIEGEQRVAYDYGWLRTCPDLPGVQAGDLVVIGWNSPWVTSARGIVRTQRELQRAVPHFESQLETHVSRNIVEHDLPYLRRLASAGVRVAMYGPQHIAESGATFDIDPALNLQRENAARKALSRGPVWVQPTHS